jgi:hypothetical protein
MAYYAARESLQSWGSEFGYQLVDEDWTLTYPPRDPGLAEVEARAVEEARQRLQWLAQVRPVRRAKPTQQFRAAPTRGGVMSEDGPSVLGDQSRWNWTEEQAAAGGAQAGPGRGVRAGGDGAGDTARGDPLVGRGGTNGANAAAAGGVDGGGQPGGYSGPTRFYAGASAPRGVGPGSPGGESGGTSASELAGGAAGSGDSGADGQAGVDASGADGSTSVDAASGTGSKPGATGESNSLAGAGTAGAGANGGSSGASGGANGSSSASGGSGGPSLPGMASGGQAGGASATLGSNGGAGSMAGRRGSNWASLATQDRPIPLTRPIRLECAATEFRILAAGGRVQSRIPIGTYTAEAVDPLVRELHAEVGRWGLAGDRMYWKPLLVLSATADGQSRRDDLEKLLVDSGIDTRRSEIRDKVHPLPPVIRTGAVLPAR